MPNLAFQISPISNFTLQNHFPGNLAWANGTAYLEVVLAVFLYIFY